MALSGIAPLVRWLVVAGAVWLSLTAYPAYTALARTA